jgi:uncharacterized membrane protein YqgA involved in biofilm formation
MLENIKDWCWDNAEKLTTFFSGWYATAYGITVYVILLALLIKAGMIMWAASLIASLAGAITGGLLTLHAMKDVI